MYRCLRHLALLMVSVTLLTAATTHAQDIDTDKASRVKAAFLLNFIKYSQWPREAFESSSSPIVLTVVGNDGLGNNLNEIVRRSEVIDGRAIELRRVNRPLPDGQGLFNQEELDAFNRRVREAHLLFIPLSERDNIRPILAAAEGGWTLTVSDAPRFCGRGGMLGLVLQEGRIAYEANPEEIKQASVTVSAKVLKLARIVKTAE